MRFWHVLLSALLLVTLAACGGDSDVGEAVGDAAPDVSFSAPEDGATVTSPVQVEMQAEGLNIEEAGEVVEGAGHFHVMIDTPCVPEGQTIPNDEQHVHFGDASTEADLDLEPGEHTLCLQAGDGAHNAIGSGEQITVTVEE